MHDLSKEFFFWRRQIASDPISWDNKINKTLSYFLKENASLKVKKITIVVDGQIKYPTFYRTQCRWLGFSKYRVMPYCNTILYSFVIGRTVTHWEDQPQKHLLALLRELRSFHGFCNVNNTVSTHLFLAFQSHRFL